MFPDSTLIKRLVKLAIDEDISRGDITTALSINPGIKASADIVAKESLVVCGLPIVDLIFSELKWDVKFNSKAFEGDRVKVGTVIAVLRGSAHHLLSAERTILNFLQRLSGVASLTRKFATKAKGLVLLDTRKTMPGYRLLDKYAVRIGGAKNHRMDLSDLVLVKNNHIDANGGSVTKTLSRIYADKSPYIPIEVEVRDLKELNEALSFCPDIIMLDNFKDMEIKRALKIICANTYKPLIEISGGVRESRFSALKKLGVKFVSCGALTTQARMVDISMRVKLMSQK